MNGHSVNAALDTRDDQAAEFPVKADLKSEIYRPLPHSPAQNIDDSVEPTVIAEQVLDNLNIAIQSTDPKQCELQFDSAQAYWRDLLAFTYHFRTLEGSTAISLALVELVAQRQPGALSITAGSAQLVARTPTLTWLECKFSFKTLSPKASCSGMLQMLPSDDGQWKIWVIRTWLDQLEDFPEQISRLDDPTPKASGEAATVDTLIVGAGNSGLITAARLKALGVTALLIEQNQNVGDNWASRYDSENVFFNALHTRLRFGYTAYDEDAPQFLGRQELISHCKRYASEFDLNIWTSSRLASTTWNEGRNCWVVSVDCPEGFRTVHAKHIVQATGMGCRMPYLPLLSNESSYTGRVMHSTGYKTAAALVDQGVKSVIVVGSGVTAFDIMAECCRANLQTTMVQRSSTYVLPVEYERAALGIYEQIPLEEADNLSMTGPVAIGSQLFAMAINAHAEAEPHRYDKLRASGLLFERKGDFLANLLQQFGGYYLVGPGDALIGFLANTLSQDVGATSLIMDGKVAIKSGVSPIAYTSAGLQLSDGTSVAADAIIFATGFADKDFRATAASVLGDGGLEISRKLDATWALDIEGEIRGFYKRQLQLDNYWTIGGGCPQMRFYSKFLTLQIKAALENILPAAYRATPSHPLK